MDITKCLLGKRAAKKDKRTLQLKDFLLKVTPPPAANWFKDQTSFGEMGNDVLGDCTCAAVGHAVQIATLNTPDGEVTPADSAVLSLYENACGYVPGDPSTDQGGVIIDVLNYVRKNLFDTHKLWAYADPDPADLAHVQQAIAVFGVVDIGLQLPVTAQSQVGGIWDVVGDPNSDPNSQPGSWGGHSVSCGAYSQVDDTITCVTWGALQKMTSKFWLAYCDEAHALLLRAWMERFGAQSRVQLGAMEKALQAVSG